MRVEFLPSIDFNQMLVYSTFVHLLFLTWVMFLPDPRTQEQIVVPTFRLDLIELSPKAKPASSPKKKVAPIKKPIAKKLTRSKLKPKAKQLPPPKPIIKKSKPRKKILADLKSLESNLPKQSTLQQLDLLSRLTPKAQEKKITSPKAMQEETFRELEREKEAELPAEPKPEKLLPRVDDIEITKKESESIALSEQLVKLDLKKEAQSTSSLMKELEAIEKKEIHPTDILLEGEHFEESKSPSAFKDIKGDSLTSVVEKFQELEDSSEEIKIDISQGRVVFKEFKTSIQRSGAPVPETESEVSSALSLYVGGIYKRIYSRWKTPLGQKISDVVVSFTIFSKGNINNPTIRKSAGDKNLDSIAVRAILSSVPFPALPKELHRSNLKINIVFNYVPEKN
ncbi:MAG TPA: TonB family protein [Nitrospinaceae bacterium]|nr:TonB family protein [Nitrospinaceae bacterium]